MTKPGVLVCRPCDLDATSDFDALILSTTFTYEGSVRKVCVACGCDVWLGPNGQAYLAADPKALIGCFRCVALSAVTSGLEYEITSLDNPEPPPWVVDPGVDPGARSL